MPSENKKAETVETADALTDAVIDAALEQSIFEDGADFEGRQDVRLYSFTVEKGGTTFYFNELSKPQREYALSESKAIQAEGKRIQRAQKQLEWRAKSAGTVDEAAEDELADASETLARRSMALSEWVLENTLVDWSNPKWANKVPCTTEMRAKLKPTPRAELGDEVLSRSFSGRGVEQVAKP